ncbi:uncharacterized protein [Palaemon carinicauda]|uniref:uncharacterized protein n=1 Tax=Palaemon carinicauda TaxID=392227 RepID=UPI0035B6A830
MNFLLLGVILFAQTFFSYGMSSKTKNIYFKYGNIVERQEDIFITSTNVIVEVHMQAIFLQENDVTSLRTAISRFSASLDELHRRHFHLTTKSLLSSTLKIAEMLSDDLKNKTGETGSLAYDLLMWTVGHEQKERRNPFIYAALSIFGSVASLGLGLSNRLKISNQNKKIEFLTHKDELIMSELRDQLASINKIMDLLNEHSDNIVQIMEVQDLLATLTYYDSKIDHIHNRIAHFIEKSKDYVEAITLATKGVLSPHLLPIRYLKLVLENTRDKLGYVPLLDEHRLEFYYSLITVNVDNNKIRITIPFDSSDAWQSYRISPFPTFMTNHSNPVISSLTGHVLISPDKETYTVIKDLNQLTHCSDAMDRKICTADSFEFRKNLMDSCELGIVLDGALSHTSENCLDKLYPFDNKEFNCRLNNGSWIRYDKDGFNISCPDGSTSHNHIFVAADGCIGTSPNSMVTGLRTIIRERAYFANFTWTSTTPALPLPYKGSVAKHLMKLTEKDHLSPTYKEILHPIILASLCFTVMIFIAVNILVWRRLRHSKQLQRNELNSPDNTPYLIQFKAV